MSNFNTEITAGSLFSGIGVADLAFGNAGITVKFQCEINPKAISVLTHHWPDVERFTDVKEIGTCQSENPVESGDVSGGSVENPGSDSFLPPEPGGNNGGGAGQLLALDASAEIAEDTTSKQLTFSWAGSPAKTCPLPEKGKVLLESGQAYGTNLLELLTSLSRHGLSLKMSPVFYPAKEESTLPLSFSGWQNGGMAFPGGCLTLNITEWPNDAAVCLLSEVLETDVAPKYFLSPKACAGILRRAEKRGKALPPMLERSLKAIAAKEKTTPSKTPDKDTGMTMKQEPLFELLPAQAPTKPI